MNKDFWERIDRLEELAGKAIQEKQEDTSWGNIERLVNKYLTTANPAMILKMIAEMRRLENENSKLKRLSEFVAKEALRLGKEADWLAKQLSDVADHASISEWREAARKATEEVS